jgi:hypothetical protein
VNKEIGRVKDVYVGFEDHGLFCYMVNIEFDGSAQSYGPFILASNSAAMKRGDWPDESLSRGMHKLVELHEFFKVQTLSGATGKYIEVEREHPYSNIERIHRLPVDGGAVFDAQK